MKRLLLFACLFGFSFLAKSQTPASVKMGANLFYNGYWTPTQWFTDWMKQSNDLLSCIDNPDDASCDATIPRDADGNPMAPFSVIVKNPWRAEWAGFFTLKFEGFATLKTFDNQIVISNQSYDSASNQMTATIEIPASAGRLALGFDAPMSGVIRDIRLVPQGIDPDDFPTFRQVWLDHLSRFSSLRFMSWNVGFEDNFISSWADRRQASDHSQMGKKSVAWEHVIELANALEKDIWLSIPVRADDHYIDSLATMLKTQLKPSLKIRFEYGNEVWAANWMSNFNFSTAVAEVQAGNSNLNFDGSTDQYRWSLRRNARRTKEIGDRFEQVFGPGSRGVRFFPVLTYQADSPNYGLQTALDFLENQYGPLKNQISVVAAAPYLSATSFAQGSNSTAADVLDEFQNGIDFWGDGYPRYLEEGVAMTRWQGLDFQWYEGGTTVLQSAAAPPPSVVCEALKSAEIKPLLHDYFSKWYAFGPENDFMWFVAGATDWCEGDFYGLTFSETEQQTPALQAIDELLAAPAPPVSAGHEVPGCVDTRADVSRPSGWENEPLNEVFFTGQTEAFLLRAAADGWYPMRLVVARHPTISGLSQLSVNHEFIGTWTAPLGPQGGKDTTATTLQAFLKKGLNVLKIKYLNQQPGNWCLLVGEPVVAEHSPLPTRFEVKIRPNPAVDFVEITLPEAAPFSWKIIDWSGRVLQTGHAFSEKEKLNLTGLPAGFLVVELAIGQVQQRVRVMKN